MIDPEYFYEQYDIWQQVQSDHVVKIQVTRREFPYRRIDNPRHPSTMHLISCVARDNNGLHRSQVYVLTLNETGWWKNPDAALDYYRYQINECIQHLLGHMAFNEYTKGKHADRLYSRYEECERPNW